MNASVPRPDDLSSLVAALRAAGKTLDARRRELGHEAPPSRQALHGVVRDLRSVLFPSQYAPPDLTDEGLDYFVGHTLDVALRDLTEQIRRALAYARADDPGSIDELARDAAARFASRLARVRSLLESDVWAAYQGDPTASSLDETIFSYPGIAAITHHRIAHELQLLGVPLIPRMIAELAHAETGIDIHPGAEIGASFFIDHGTGVVIGETAQIGARVRVFQGVTLGARSASLDEAGHSLRGIARHPIVEDDVVIYAGATILGRVRIGQGSSIGGNVWLTESVPARSRISQAQVRTDEFEAGGGI